MTGEPSGAHRRLSTATAAGREDTRLIVIRGNSASGKSSVAQGLRDHYGRGIAIVGQDVIRRNVLREHDTARGANIALLGRIAREALNADFHVVLEGILYADRYSHMITSLVRDHRGVSRCYYLDVPLETTLVRHASKADAAYLEQVTDNHLTSWYRELDLLPGSPETVINDRYELACPLANLGRFAEPVELHREVPREREAQLGSAARSASSASPRRTRS